MSNEVGNNIKVYLKPFDDDGNYQDDWINITKYVERLPRLTMDLDSADYQIGVFRFSDVSIDVNNRDGLFDDAGSIKSYFKYNRNDSQVKFTYQMAEAEPECGIAVCGASLLAEEIELFKGLLNDDSFRLSANTEKGKFKVLGFESLFNRATVPYSDISNGDTVKELIVACLDQSPINTLLTIDADNIDPSLNQASDDVSDLENKSVKQALDTLLLESNSVLYVQDDTVYVTDRDPSATVQQTFYGQASADGRENIIDIKNFNSGAHRIFNLFVDKDDNSTSSSDASSILLNGAKKREVDFSVFTNSTKIDNILDELLAEFKNRKTELEIVVPMDYDTIELNLLDRIAIDYPTVYYPTEGEDLPICGVAICGEAVLPRGLWTLLISSDTGFKIMKKDLNLNRFEITFKLREV